MLPFVNRFFSFFRAGNSDSLHSSHSSSSSLRIFSREAREAKQQLREVRLAKADIASLLIEVQRLQHRLEAAESTNTILRSEVEKLAAVNERDRQRVLAETQKWVAKAVVLERDGLHRETRQSELGRAAFEKLLGEHRD